MGCRHGNGNSACLPTTRNGSDHTERQFDRYERLLGKHALLVGEFADGAAERLVGHGERGLHVIGESGLDMPCKHHGNHLASIVETRGGWTRTYRFSYSRSDYPESFEYHIQGQYVNLTDTYTLRWRNGNLVSAVCGSGNDRYNIDSITYNYDNNLNPFCGLLLPKFFENYGIVDAPLFLSRNIPTGITYYTTSGSVQDIYYTLNFSFTDSRPTQIVHQYENFYWCSYTDTYTLHY